MRGSKKSKILLASSVVPVFLGAAAAAFYLVSRYKSNATPDRDSDKVGEASAESFPASDAPGWR